ncbi:COG4252 Predicted transmembrane sensor domain [uncultured Caudovirales phage]|uniref:COG4252 Predicted transmembrane sensor domain n=1 Tax=uncultured Caudovirales phage TaxID=2100421 RepID=A0A6J5T5G9_9CAUD|nr:COG4252 Predicted transmembrane sensor domain [uncultured Caudovirales phage]
MKKLFLSPWLSLVTLGLIIGLRVVDPSFVESIRLRYFDTLLTQDIQQSDIQLVNIDDATLKEKGQFPFPRNEYATLIKELYIRGAGLVVFNLFMPEADRFDKDDTLTQVLQEYPVVLPQTGTNEAFTETYKPFRPGVSVIGTGDVGVKYENILPNIQVFNDNAAGIGVVNTLPEIDGVTRRIPMVVSSKGLLYPSISLETLRVASGDPSFQVKINEGSIQAVRIPKFGKIQTDDLGRLWIKPAGFRQFSSVSLPNDFNGAIVIVGLTAKGLNNPVATSNGAVFPHYIQASILDTITKGINISRPDWATGAELLTVLVLCIISILIARWKYGILIFFGIIISLYPISNYLYTNLYYLFDITLPVFAIIAVYGHTYTVKFLTELGQKLQIKKQFGTYLSPDYVEKLQKNPDLLKLGGDSKELTIYFSDIRSFTTISEHYKTDPQGLTNLITRYMDKMLPIIMNNEGTVGKLIGDAIMAWWGAPLDVENQASKALKAAKEMEFALEELNIELVSEGKPPLQVGAGISTGTVFVGNMGSKDRFSYDILGDEVNLAARLEGQTKNYGVSLILSKNTIDKLKSENV